MAKEPNEQAYFAYGEKEMEHLKSHDARLGAAIDRIGPISRPVNGDLFAAVVRNIVAQQISGVAAQMVLKRLKAASCGITAANLAAMSESDIQKCGTSMKKAQYIRDFACKVACGEFDISAMSAMEDEDVIAALSSLRGIGRWTAEMLLLFTLQRPNVLSYLDLGIHRGMRMVYRHRKITKEMFERYRRRFSPYGSIASLYFWAVAGGAIPELTDPALGRNSRRNDK